MMLSPSDGEYTRGCVKSQVRHNILTTMGSKVNTVLPYKYGLLVKFNWLLVRIGTAIRRPMEP